MKQSDFIVETFSTSNRQTALSKYLTTCTLKYDARIQTDLTFTNMFDKKVRFSALFSNDGFIYALHLEKRREKRVRMQSMISQGKVSLFPWFVKKEREWIGTIYRFPLKNIISFEQYGNHFDIKMYNDEMIEHLKNVKRGFPERDSEGYFIEKKAFGQIADQLTQKHYYLSRFSTAKVMEGIQSLGMLDIRLDFDILTGRSRILKPDGSIPSDEELKATLKL